MDNLLPVFVMVTLCLSRSVNANYCTFISEDTNTCDVNIECSLSAIDFKNVVNNHSCTTKQKLTRVLTYRTVYDYYDNPRRIPDKVEEYEGEYSREFQLKLSFNRINFKAELQYLIEQSSELMPRVKTVTIQDCTGAPGKFLSHFKELHHIELHTTTDLNTIDLNMFLEFEHMKKIDISNSSIFILETKSQSSFASKVMDINLSYNNIQEIPNNYFVHFPELRNLDLSNNNLKSLELSTFTGLLNLQNLQLSYNNLTNIGHSLVKLINLEELLIDNNQLRSVLDTNLLTTTKLKRLNMSSNQISLIENQSFETLAELNVIDLGNNTISTVSKWWFANNTNLGTVILSNNKINKIEQGSFNSKNITTFEIENNCLTGILETGTFEGLHLERLDLSNGKLTQIKDNAFNSSFIHKLNLSSNSIHNISKKAFISLDMTDEIDISNNSLTYIEIEMFESSKLSVLKVQNNSITEISATSFINLTSVSYIDLSCNSISKVEPQSFFHSRNLKTIAINNNEFVKILPGAFFQGLTEVTDINLSFTRIIQIQNESFTGLNNLNILNVSHSELAKVDYNVFENTGSIRILDLSYNLLKVFHINTSTILGITEIRLGNNQLKQITPATFFKLVSLQTLNLANNELAKLEQNELSSLENLNDLDLSFNTNLEINGSIFSNLTRIVKVNLRNVKGKFEFEHVTNTSIDVLDLSHCSIEEIDKIFVYNVADVYNLNLASNKITRLSKFSFQTMPSLAELDLSDNLISFIQPGTYIHTNKITSLNLSGNQLSHLQFGVLDGLQILHTLNLSSNALREFSSTLFHNTPTVNSIVLDNNALEDLKFSEFGSKVLSIGGNPIPCHILTEVKSNSVVDWTSKVKAEKKDYHSENVGGITCISDNPNTKTVLRVNDTNINSTVTVAALSNLIDVFRSSIEKLDQNLNNSSNTAGYENSKILHGLSESNNQLRSYLKQLTDMSAAANNGTYNFYSDIKDLFKNLTLANEKSTERIIYVNTNATSVVDEHLLEKIKTLNEENDKIVYKLKDMITEFKNDSNRYSNAQPLKEVKSYSEDIKGILYFIAVCLTIIIIGFICITAYLLLVVPRNGLVRGNGLHNSVSSTRPISNVLEMQ